MAITTITTRTAKGSALTWSDMDTNFTNLSVHGIGYGQTWTNVTASRVFGTKYTNNTGKPIMVHVGQQLHPGSGVVACLNYVSIDPAPIIPICGATILIPGQYTSVTAIIPPNATYSVSGIANGINTIWAELS